MTRNIIALLCGKYDTVNLEYIKSHMNLSDSVRYVYLEPYDIGDMSEHRTGGWGILSDSEKTASGLSGFPERRQQSLFL